MHARGGPCSPPKQSSDDACRVAQDFPTLVLKLQQYTHTTGKALPLLLAEGTLPMYYQACAPAPGVHEGCAPDGLTPPL